MREIRPPGSVRAKAEWLSYSTIDLKRLFLAIWEKRLFVLLIVMLAGLAAFAVTSTMHPVYKADARVLIEARSGLPGSGNAAQASDQNIVDSQAVASQVQVIQSSDLIQDVIKKLHLSDKPEFAAKPSLLNRLLALVHVRTGAKATQSQQDIIDKFTKKLNVYQVTNSRVIVIEFSSEDPKLAAAVSNALANDYLLQQSGLKLSDDSAATTWLEPEIAKLRKRVNDAETKVADFRARSYGRNWVMRPVRRRGDPVLH